MSALDETEAMLIAAQMVACRPECVMPVCTVVLGVDPPPYLRWRKD